MFALFLLFVYFRNSFSELFYGLMDNNAHKLKYPFFLRGNESTSLKRPT